MPREKKSSRLPAVLILAAVAAAAVYGLFLRGSGPSPAPAAAATTAPAAAPAAPAPTAEAPPEPPPPPPAPARPEPVPPPPNPEPPAPPSLSAEIEDLLAAGKWREARTRLAPAFAGPLSDADRTALAKKGMDINRLALLSEAPDEKEVELYEIRQGDTLEGIARRFKNLSGVKGSILLVNNYRENTILRTGRKIRIARGTWSIVVDKSLFRLYVCHEGAPFKEYPVAIGTDQKTPAGRFLVGVRNPKPPWWPPAELQIKDVPVRYGDPRNPLGEWWISLEHERYHGLGIHGTNDPASIGTKASNGCIRMLNEDVGEVAALAYKGMVVTILE